MKPQDQCACLCTTSSCCKFWTILPKQFTVRKEVHKLKQKHNQDDTSKPRPQLTNITRLLMAGSIKGCIQLVYNSSHWWEWIRMYVEMLYSSLAVIYSLYCCLLFFWCMAFNYLVLPSIHHNEICDLKAIILWQTSVTIKPPAEDIACWW